MEWLKEILEKTALTDDGKLDIDAVIKAAATEFPKHAVPKKDYNDKVAELKIANDTVIELKAENGDNAELQRKIGEYETKIGDLEKENTDTKKLYDLKDFLSKAGVLDPDYLVYKAGGIEKFTFDKENKPIGVEEVVKPYKEDKAMSHLFKAASGTNYNPAGGGNPAPSNPFAKESYNLTEQGKMLKENPAQARQLASAAGVTI